MTPYKVLIVEDDSAIRKALSDALKVSGYGIVLFDRGDVVKTQISRLDIDFALLDISLPGADGFEVLSEIRHYYPHLPVIMLTAKGSEEDRIKGLNMGADDYIVKPFSILELLARISAVIRRTPERTKKDKLPTIVNLINGKIDFENYQIIRDDKAVELTGKEYELLLYLVRKAGQILSKEEIMFHVWQMNLHLVETRALDATLKRVRIKLGKENAGMIKTIRGRGYLWQN